MGCRGDSVPPTPYHVDRKSASCAFWLSTRQCFMGKRPICLPRRHRTASDAVCVSTWQSAQKKEGDLSHLDFLVTPFWLLGAIAPASNAEISLSRSYMPWVQWPMSRPRSFYSALRLHRGRDVPALRAGPARMSSWMDSLTWPHTLELGQHSIEELAG